MARVYIIAGTTLQFNNFIYGNHLTPVDYKLVRSLDEIRGCCQQPKVIKLGTWHNNHNLVEIEEYLTHKNVLYFTPEEWLEKVNANK